MVGSTDLPDGTYVVWQGRTYPGSVLVRPPRTVVLYSDTAEDDLFTPGRTGGFERVVPDSEVTMFRLTTTCRWRGAPFQVLDRDPQGRLGLLYLGGSPQEAQQLGLSQQDRTTFGTVRPESEVTDLVQTRSEIDLTRRAR
jgi:hypothetical protein